MPQKKSKKLKTTNQILKALEEKKTKESKENKENKESKASKESLHCTYKEDGILVRQSNKSCCFVMYPTKEVSGEPPVPKEEINKLFAVHNAYARNKGANGFKRNTDGTYSGKDIKSKKRLIFHESGNKNVEINGTEHSVPCFSLTRIQYK